jgi:hypothetical protein
MIRLNTGSRIALLLLVAEETASGARFLLQAVMRNAESGIIKRSKGGFFIVNYNYRVIFKNFNLTKIPEQL